jgi:hypothetical protein
MWRDFGISLPLPVALHTVASQHISTLHNTSGTHILRYVPAQVKHHPFFHPTCDTKCVRTRGRDAAVSVRQIGDSVRCTCHAHHVQ